MKRIGQTWRLILLYTIIAVLLGVFMPRQLDWSPSFSMNDTVPYGAEAIHETLDQMFSADISIVEQPLYNVLDDTLIENTNYVIINSDFYIDSLDLSALYGMVNIGNNVFIGAENFNREFLDSLGVSSQTHFNNFANLKQVKTIATEMSILPYDTSFEFRSQWSNTYFQSSDSSDIELLGIGQQDSLYNYVKVPYGSGHFYLHSFPFAMTNYYLLKDETRDYVSSVFSQLPQHYDLVWDEYYKPGRSERQKSPLSVLMNYPSFRWAYWLTIGGLLLFMIFYAKRQQRPIPIIKPPKNESLAFTTTLGGLYYNKGSHKDIFIKKVKVLREQLSSKYFMRDLEFSEAEAVKLATKSGRDPDLVKRVFSLAKEYESKASLSDGQLKAFVKKVNQFYQHT